jgi:aldehyde:ferredoxin oxidoreductase
MGKILRVELTRGRISEEPLTDEYAKNYIGGVGTASRILYDEVPPWVGALDPQNRLIFSTGPVTGSPALCAGRHFIVSKSPLSGYFGDSSAGGFWGAELKFAGYDMIIIHGKAQKPVYIWIHDGEVEIKDATSYWGMGARQADRAIRNDLGDKSVRVADIGQAGENLVRYAAIMSDEASRAAGRCGVGAVMGYKNVKAIAVRGHKKVPVADEEALEKNVKRLLETLKGDTQTNWFSKHGSSGYYAMMAQLGDTPTLNWTKGYFDGKNGITSPGGYDKISVGHATCYNCPIACRRLVTVKDEPYAFEPEVEGPEYETVGALGSNCGISNVKALAKANDLCNIYGLDTISAGGTLAFAMECYERGLISKEDTDGMELRFGNGLAVIRMLEKTAKREGFGNILAEGSRRASLIIGRGTEHYAMHVKGLEIAMHDPRAFQAMGLTYATAPVGGDHMEGETTFVEKPGKITYAPLKLNGLDRFSTERKAEAAFKVQNLWHAIGNAMGYCLLACATGTTAYPLKYNLMFYNAVTGQTMHFEEMMKIGERIYNLKRAFTIKHGATRGEDSLPERILMESHAEGGSKGSVCKLGEMIPEYYKLRGWDQNTGKPTREKLEELNLPNVATDLLGHKKSK